MKADALQAVQDAYRSDNDHHPENTLRHFLQQEIMRGLFEQGAFDDWVYHGGVCLQDFYDVPRFSRDLDFHLDEEKLDYDFSTMIDNLKDHLDEHGYTVEIGRLREADESNAVQTAELKFAGGLMHEANLTNHEDQKMMIRVENDARAPEGWTTKTVYQNDQIHRYSVPIHDLETILADKIVAMSERDWDKGRDYFDVMYLCQKHERIQPNFSYLNNAINQQRRVTGNEPLDEPFNETNWQRKTADCMRTADWDDLKEDLNPLLESPADRQLFTKTQAIQAVQSVRPPRSNDESINESSSPQSSGLSR